MKVVVIGGVAAGPKVASRIIRMNPEAEITIIEKGEFLSYAGCGLPYYISGVVKEQKDLMATGIGVVRDTEFFRKVKNIKVMNHTEALSIDRKNKLVEIRKADGTEGKINYDKLVIATGASPVVPPLPGIELENIFTLHGIEDSEGIKALVKDRKAQDAVIVGGGLIGVEMAEALMETGCRVTIVELLPQILSMLDPEMSAVVKNYLGSKGVKVLTSTKVTGFEGQEKVAKVLTSAGALDAELVILSIGVRPNVKLASDCGLELGETSGIKVDRKMQTSDPDIFAAGDCVAMNHLITGKECFIPLGSTANKQGRVAANSICGYDDDFPGVLGSAVCKAFDFNIARTGLGELEAIKQGIEAVSCLAPGADKPHFMPNANPLFLKLIAERGSRKVLGAQAVGPGEADKRINVVATAIAAGMTVDQLAELDLCYAPPYSPAMDNLITAANVMRNILDSKLEAITNAEVKAKFDRGDDFVYLDVRSPGEYENMRIEPSTLIPLGKLRERLGELDPEKETVVACKTSLRAYEASLILKKAGFKDVKVMLGGIVMWPYERRP